MQSYSLPDNCNFEMVIKNGFGRNGTYRTGTTECTPKIKDIKFVGIVINGPKEIHFENATDQENDLAVPICGISSHDLGIYIDKNRSLMQSMIFVVTDVKSNQTWQGRIPGIENPVLRPKPKNGENRKFTREEMKGRINRQPFNVNLINLTGMKLRETEYVIYVTVGPYKSNVLTIKAIKGKH